MINKPTSLYVIYNIDTTIIVSERPSWDVPVYATVGAAKAGLTRLVRKGKVRREECGIAEYNEFHNNIELQVTKHNLMTGDEFSQPVNTPRCCDPSSETYWSM